jgi:hypothetical protein
MKYSETNLIDERKTPNTACTGQVRAVGRTFGILAPTADSASGSFSRQLPPLPVTPAVGPLFLVTKLLLSFYGFGKGTFSAKAFPRL